MSAARFSDLVDETVSISSSMSPTPTERSPLLPGKLAEERNGSWKTEFRWLLFNSLPVIGTYLLQISLQLASIFTLGHLVRINKNKVVTRITFFAEK